MPENIGYAEIAAQYRQQIQDGQLRPGDAMPSLRKVCEQFGVAQTTANRAFRMLKLEGLTLARPGVGTVVAGPSSSTLAARVLSESSLSDSEASRTLEIGTIGADELIAPRLAVTPGTPVHVQRRIVSRDGVPVYLSSAFYPAYVIAAAPELKEPASTDEAREMAAERLGVAQRKALEEVTSRPATESERTALGLTAGDVVVTQVVRTVTLEDDRVIEVAVKVVGGSTILRWASDLRPAIAPVV
ncbi:GntR family transcriptional regulator [Streptomyces rectiviolaceus]|uniref:GntR family transcriptional regulator n=1 Tax=Streptomyces rectiviolaceus TaxID=332591 RepID=UPI00362B40EB